MPRPVNRLTARTVATLKEPGLHADGHGLYLQVDPSEAKRWVFVFQWQGKRKEMGLGGTSLVSLAEAREARDTARKRVFAGVNPIEARREARTQSGAVTFGQVAEEVLRTLKPELESPKHFKQWERSLRETASTLTDRPVASITTEDVLAVLRPIWEKTPETASRTRARIERVLGAAKAKNLRIGENPARWKDHLDHLLSTERERGHFAALPYAEAPSFMTRLRAKDGLSALALEWTILSAARENMTLGARVKEIEGDIWRVPADRMKGKKGKRRDFAIPLTPAMARVLDRAWPDGLPADPDAFIFPSIMRRGRPMSNAAMDRMLEGLVKGYTVHGFRSTFSDWVADKTEFPREVREASLGHTLNDKVEAAYRRGDALEKRRKLMDAWATFLG